MLVAMQANDAHIGRWLCIFLAELIGVLAALVSMIVLAIFAFVALIAGAYGKGLAVLAVFAGACVALRWIGKRLHHWVKLPPPPVHGWISAKYAPLVFALARLPMGAWMLYLVAHGLADGEMWTLRSQARNTIVSVENNPAAYWLTVAKGTYLSVAMFYGAFWFVHHRRRVIKAALAAQRRADVS